MIVGLLLAACSAAPPAPETGGDPNAAGRAATAAALPSAAPGAPVGSGICANETLAESLARAVEAGASVVLATGAFTGSVRLGDGEIGVPYSEVALTEASTLAGPPVTTPVSAWVLGNLAADGSAGTPTGETSSLWARGGRLIAIVDPAPGSGLPGPIIRVTPVVGNDVVMGWVGCWSTQGVPSRDFDATVDIFDNRGLHPTEMQLSAVSLDDFRSALPDR